MVADVVFCEKCRYQKYYCKCSKKPEPPEPPHMRIGDDGETVDPRTGYCIFLMGTLTGSILTVLLLGHFS